MISGIVAIENNQGIGFQGSMPWPHLKHDMQWFKSTTLNQVVIMGSITWASLPKPLPNRINIVIGKSDNTGSDHRFLTPQDAINACALLYPDKDIFIIGGQALYNSTMELIDRWFVTHIDQSYQCDKFFNFAEVQQSFPTVIEHAHYCDPIIYSMKEYRK